MQRICVTLTDNEHRAAGGFYARDVLIASVPLADGVTSEQVQSDAAQARRKRKG